MHFERLLRCTPHSAANCFFAQALVCLESMAPTEAIDLPVNLKHVNGLLESNLKCGVREKRRRLCPNVKSAHAPQRCSSSATLLSRYHLLVTWPEACEWTLGVSRGRGGRLQWACLFAPLRCEHNTASLPRVAACMHGAKQLLCSRLRAACRRSDRVSMRSQPGSLFQLAQRQAIPTC